MARLKATRSVWVTVDERRFRVDYDAAGEPIRIAERKQKKSDKEWLRYLYNAPYWHRDHNRHAAMKPWTVVARILAEARNAS